MKWARRDGGNVHTNPGVRRALLAVVAVATATAGSLIAVATPASASPTYTDAPLVSWAYTDSAHPTKTYLNPTSDVPLGAWTDSSGTVHESRVYATFDVSSYNGEHLLSAGLYFEETQATDCADRSVEAWATTTSTKPTWAARRASTGRRTPPATTRSRSTRSTRTATSPTTASTTSSSTAEPARAPTTPRSGPPRLTTRRSGFAGVG